MHVLCFPSIASVVLVLGSAPASDRAAAPADEATSEPAELPADLDAPLHGRPAAPGSAHLPAHGVAPLSDSARARSPALASSVPEGGAAPLRANISERESATGWLPGFGVAPLNMRLGAPGGGADPRASVPAGTIVAPFGRGPSRVPGRPDSRASAPIGSPASGEPSLTPDLPDPRALRVVRLELLVGPVWRIRTAETLLLASLEVGRLQGFSGTFHAGMFVAPDREFVGVNDFPIGAGFVARRRLGQRSLFGSVGLTAGILVHRAATDLGVIHRVDPDFQLPLRFGWTAGRVGLSVALLQGFSVRTRSYSRRGVEVWERIPYRIGFAVGLHFDAGVGPAKPRRSAHYRRQMP